MQIRIRTDTISIFSFLILGIVLPPQNAAGQAQPLAKTIDSVLHKAGNDNHLNYRFCEPMGLTRSQDQSCPTKQSLVSFGTGDGDDRFPENIIDVGTDAASGQVKVVLWYRTKTDATLYVTSAGGGLAKALRIANSAFSEIPPSPAVSLDFEKEKAFWIQHFGGP